MKTIKFLNSLFTAVLFILGFATVCQGIGIDFTTGAEVATGLTLVNTVAVSFNSHQMSGTLQAGIFREVWTGEVLKKMRLTEMYTWVQAITKDYSRFVTPVGEEAEVIHLASFPIEPDVLIDNTTYPIASQTLTTSDVPIALNKYQTKVTPISDDVLFANTTNPMQLHSESHSNAIMRNKFAKGAWNICPTGNAAATPVIVATGGNDGTNRKKLLWDDLMSFKRKLDAAEIDDTPGTRIIVLDKDHENDLASVDQVFKDKFYDFATGKPYNGLGFTFYPSNANPYYNFTTLAKQSLGVAPTSAMRRATMFFSTERVGKAIGSTKLYFARSENDPANQVSTMNARHYHLITRLMNEGVGAIVSPDAA